MDPDEARYEAMSADLLAKMADASAAPDSACRFFHRVYEAPDGRQVRLRMKRGGCDGKPPEDLPDWYTWRMDQFWAEGRDQKCKRLGIDPVTVTLVEDGEITADEFYRERGAEVGPISPL